MSSKKAYIRTKKKNQKTLEKLLRASGMVLQNQDPYQRHGFSIYTVNDTGELEEQISRLEKACESSHLEAECIVLNSDLDEDDQLSAIMGEENSEERLDVIWQLFRCAGLDEEIEKKRAKREKIIETTLLCGIAFLAARLGWIMMLMTTF